MGLDLQVRVLSTGRALMLLALSSYLYALTILSSPPLIFNIPQLRSEHFRRLIEWIGPSMADNPDHNAVLHDRLLPHMHGTVLDVGPGDGAPLHSFAPFVKNVDVVYGIEPNERLHRPLLAAASKAGFNDASSKGGRGRYIPLKAGVEPPMLFPALASAGLIESDGSDSFTIPKEGVFDAIVSIKALCSSDSAKANMAATIAVLHKLLKPGGQLLMLEHVANDEDMFASGTQRVLNTVWTTLIGGCSLRGTLAREMRRLAREGKQWRSVDVRALEKGQEAHVIPFVMVRAVKAG